MRRVWLLAVLALSSVATGPEARRTQGSSQTQPGPQFGWSGTIRLVRQGSGTFPADGGGSMAVRAREEATWSIRGDMSAHYEVTYDEVDVITSPEGETGSCRYSGTGSGETLAGVALDDAAGGRPFERLTGVRGPWGIAAGFVGYKGTTTCDAPGGAITLPWSDGISEGTVDVTANDARSATHLAGSQKGTTGLTPAPRAKGLGVALVLDQVISWDVSKGGVNPTPALTIYGPHCQCLDSVDGDGASLRFFAATAVPGGVFSEFEVTSDGEMPEVDTNESGDHSLLELTTKPTTGAITLKAHYTKNGKRYDAAPFTVDTCAIDAIELADGEHDLSFDDESQVLTVSAKTTALFNGRDARSDIAWDIEKTGAPTRLTSSPDPARGQAVTWKYTGLPLKNSDFGPKKMSAGVKRGACDCQRHEQVRAFFVDDGGYNPAPTTVPNWFYYWQQTRAVDGVARPLLQYVARIAAANNPDDTVAARWEFASQRLLVSALINTANGCRGMVESTGDYPRPRTSRDVAFGIDCFAETIRHEMHHRKEAIDWWGSPRGFSDVSPPERLVRDRDLDGVPDDIEKGLPGCRTDGPNPRSTCLGRPFEDATDLEVNAYWVGWSWKLASADKEDWSCGPASKQWHGTRCQ